MVFCCTSKPKPKFLNVMCAHLGNKEIRYGDNTLVVEFINKVQVEFNLPKSGWRVFRSQMLQNQLGLNKTQTMGDLQFHTEDKVYLGIDSAILPDVLAKNRSSPTEQNSSRHDSIFGNTLNR